MFSSTVRALYEAIDRGDIDAVSASLADEVVWESETESAKVPWLTVCRGRDAVAAAFRNLPGVELRVVPLSFLESGDTVAVTVRFELRTDGRAGGEDGRLTEWSEVHHWQFTADGLICRLGQRSDVTTPRASMLVAGHRLLRFAPPGSD